MTPDSDEGIFDGYTSDDFERILKASEANIAELKKRQNAVSKKFEIYKQRKENNTASTQPVIIC